MQEQRVVGIVGGGQLGRMMTLAALPLGFRVVVVDPKPDCPASQVGAEQILADLQDEEALNHLAAKSDFLTVEIEHLDADSLAKIAEKGGVVNPSPSTIKLIQDKLLQKRFLSENNFPVAPFTAIDSLDHALTSFTKYKNMLIKSRRNAFDGRGNAVISGKHDIKLALEKFKGSGVYAEKAIDFAMELAVIVCKDINGRMRTYPLIQTVHKRNICIETISPAPVNAKIKTVAEELAVNAINKLKGAGVFTVEMFLLKNNELLINEIAPRVHNSGHYTLNASRTSQFEQHIRAITGLPLGSTELLHPAAVMVNILGERDGETKIEGIEKALEDKNVSVHVYGKYPTKKDRKMGHITAIGASVEECLKAARSARQLISI